jgi:hypothetical protein
MGGQPAAINGTCFGSKEKRWGGETRSQGDGGVAVPFHYGGRGAATGRRELRPADGGGLALL